MVIRSHHAGKLRISLVVHGDELKDLVQILLILTQVLHRNLTRNVWLCVHILEERALTDTVSLRQYRQTLRRLEQVICVLVLELLAIFIVQRQQA